MRTVASTFMFRLRSVLVGRLRGVLVGRLPVGREPRRRPLGILAISAVAALMLLATLGLSIVMSRRSAMSTALVDHTMRVKVAVANLLETFFEAETGERGYPFRRGQQAASPASAPSVCA